MALSSVLQVRFNDADYAAIEKASGSESVSAWARRVLLAASHEAGGSTVKQLIARKTDRVPVRPHSGKPPKLVEHRATTTAPMMSAPRTAHPISCPCEACTFARLEAPQTKGKAK